MDEERGVDKDLEDRDGDKDVSTDRNIDFVNLVRKAIFTMLAVFLYICFVRALVARGRSAPADSLNPYADRRLTFGSDGRFRLALFSDLHYGERYADNSWAAWAEEAVRVYQCGTTL
jgi:hypothetical protein